MTTSFQLANCHGFVMYTRGAAVAREQMLSANIRLWNGPAGMTGAHHTGPSGTLRAHMPVAFSQRQHAISALNCIRGAETWIGLAEYLSSLKVPTGHDGHSPASRPHVWQTVQKATMTMADPKPAAEDKAFPQRM